jgi:hypothetical protein
MVGGAADEFVRRADLLQTPDDHGAGFTQNLTRAP